MRSYDDSGFIELEYNLTDLGNAERFATEYIKQILYSPEKRSWFLWNGMKWQLDRKGEIYNLAKETVRDMYAEASRVSDDKFRKKLASYALKCESKGKLEAMIDLASKQRGIPILVQDMDSDPYKLGVENGVLDLNNMSLIAAKPEYFMTKSCDCKYNPAAKSETWENFLRECTCGDDDLSKYIQTVMGYSLLGLISEKHFWFVYGSPDSGKSTLIDAVVSMMGDYASYADFETWLIQSSVGGNRGDLVDLIGKRLVVSVEVRKGARFDEALVKRITGGDRLKCAAKYENEVEFLPNFSLVLAANDAPTIRDSDVGMWSRMRRVPFENSVPKEKQDKKLRDKLREPEAREAILNWAIDGLQMYLEDGILECKAVTDSSEEYRMQMDRIEGFLDDYCIFSDGLRVSTHELKEKYHDWAEEEGVKPISPRDFNERLRARGCVEGKINGQRGWVNITTKAEWSTSDEGSHTAPSRSSDNVVKIPVQQQLSGPIDF